MSKKILAIVCMIATILSLSACGQNGTNNHSNKAEKTSNTQKQIPEKLVTDNLTQSEQASAITVYAAMKYKGKWQQIYKQALKSHLNVSIKSQTGFNHIFKGKGYIYQISSNNSEQDNFYTLNKDKVTFFKHNKKIAVADFDKIVAYLNEQKKANIVKKLAAKTRMGARITSDKYGVKGDDGFAFIPKTLRGIWYNKKGKKLVITAHTIEGEEIHRISTSEVTTESFRQTKHWARARIENINGINCYHVQSLGAQNFGFLYTIQKEGKNVAVVTYSVDTGDYLDSYWKSTIIAKNNVHAKFKSLK